jgi:hypothetical protein
MSKKAGASLVNQEKPIKHFNGWSAFSSRASVKIIYKKSKASGNRKVASSEKIRSAAFSPRLIVEI